MRLALVIPLAPFFQYGSQICSQEFPEIRMTCFYYNDFTDVLALLKDRQKDFDAYLFAGAAPYRYMKQYCRQEINWDYIQHYGASIHRAILEASLAGCDIRKISYDSCSRRELEELYEEFGQDTGSCTQLTYEDIGNIDCYNDELYQYHKENYESKTAQCCITSLYTVYSRLVEDNIPAHFIFPTHDSWREALQKIYGTYLAQLNQNSQIVVLSLEAALPSEYSVMVQNEYRYRKELQTLSGLIYAFAQKLQAAVAEVTYRNFLIFTTQNILEVVTENLYNLELLCIIKEQKLQPVSIGIGYGEHVNEAKTNANLGLIKAKKHQDSCAYIVYSNRLIRGPITACPGTADNGRKQKQLQSIAEKADVKEDYLAKIQETMLQLHKDTFTTKELSGYLSITIRSADRLVSRLCQAGYAQVLDRRVVHGMGRPSRIIRFVF